MTRSGAVAFILVVVLLLSSTADGKGGSGGRSGGGYGGSGRGHGGGTQGYSAPRSHSPAPRAPSTGVRTPRAPTIPQSTTRPPTGPKEKQSTDASSTTPKNPRGTFKTAPRAPHTIDGSKAKVHDGDTFYANGQRYRVRGIDTPELGQARSQAATQRLEQLLRSGPVRVEPRAIDKYGRTVADVYVNGRNVADILKSEGYSKTPAQRAR